MIELAQPRFFAIVGVGRSGTTLLMSMLNAHPDITTPPELHFVSQYIVKCPYADLKETIAKLSYDPRFARLQLTTGEITQPFFEQNEPFSVVRLYQIILQTYASKRGVHIVGDKAPKNIEYLPVLHRIFPEACIIHLIRDPRDVYLSRTKAAWSSSRRDTLQFLAYRAQYDLGRRLGPRLFGDHYQEIHYENLLSQSRIELERVCHLLEVPFDDEMLSFSASAKGLVFSDEMAWKKEALGPLLTENMNKWQRELTPEQVMRIEAACSPAFEDGFYKRSRQVHTERSRLTGAMINTYMAILTAVYQRLVMFRNWKAIRAIDRQGLLSDSSISEAGKAGRC